MDTAVIYKLLIALLSPHVIIDILGLGLTIIGALITARGAYLEDKDARRVAHTSGEHNHELEHAVRRQSATARNGFLLIAVGSVLQIIAVLLQSIGH